MLKIAEEIVPKAFKMAVSIRAQFTRTDSVDKVRRFPLEVQGEGTDVFKTLQAKLVEIFPRLKDKSFTVTWKDPGGEISPISSDKEFLDAVAETAKVPKGVINLIVTEQNAEKRKKAEWLKRVKEAIPVSQRRWAKAYISFWRRENLKDISSESEDGANIKKRLDRVNHDVPEVYQQWLDFILPRWHRKWGGELEDQVKIKKQENIYKDSVPLEFRRWIRFYLDRNFGKKERPRLKGESTKDEKPTLENEENAEGSSEKKKTKKAPKLKELAQSVPVTHRRWARAYTQMWRQKNLKNVSSDEVQDDTNEDPVLDREKQDVPEVYQQWLDVILPRWHKKWGNELEKQDKAQKPANTYKDSVPVEFRKWMRCYLNRKFGKKTAPKFKDDSSAPQ